MCAVNQICSLQFSIRNTYWWAMSHATRHVAIAHIVAKVVLIFDVLICLKVEKKQVLTLRFLDNLYANCSCKIPLPDCNFWVVLALGRKKLSFKHFLRKFCLFGEEPWSWSLSSNICKPDMHFWCCKKLSAQLEFVNCFTFSNVPSLCSFKCISYF